MLPNGLASMSEERRILTQLRSLDTSLLLEKLALLQKDPDAYRLPIVKFIQQVLDERGVK